MRAALIGLLLAAGPLAAQAPRRPASPPLDSLQVWARRDSLDPLAAYQLGIGLWEKKRFGEADAAFRRALALSPQHAGALLAVAIIPFGRGDRYDFDTLRRLPADSINSLLRSSSTHYRQALLSDPLVDLGVLKYLKLEDLVPSYNTLFRWQGMVFYGGGEPWWVKRTRKGVKLLIEGSADSAFQELSKLLDAREVVEDHRTLPNLFVRYYALAAGRSGRFDRAAAGFRELAQRAFRSEQSSPDFVLPDTRADYLYFYGLMSDRAGDTTIAKAALEEALVADLSLYQAHSRLADIAEARGDVDRAVLERQRAIEVSPETGSLHVDLGITLLQAGRPVAAESAFVIGAQLLPNDPGAQQFLATVALQNHSSATARTALERFVLVAPSRYVDQVAEARRTLATLP